MSTQMGSAPVSPIIELASQGKYYKSGSGQAELQPMDGEHESMIANSDAQTFPKILDTILKECTISKPVEDFNDLLIGDKYHLLFHLRMLSYRNYGNIHKFNVTCPNCKAKNVKEVDLSNVIIKHPAVDACEPFKVYLPYCQRTAIMRLLRVKDEAKMIEFVRREKAKQQAKAPSALRGDPAYIYAMAAGMLGLSSDSGAEEPIELDSAIQFIRKAKGDDTLELRNALDDHDVGPVLECEITCDACSNYWVNTLPLDGDFFRPGSTNRRNATFSAI